jgi:chromate reductase, NAD(P)H dehydrogenase (quinone)
LKALGALSYSGWRARGCAMEARRRALVIHERTTREITFTENGDSSLMAQPITILGIPGSLRKGSYNRAALRAAQELAPETAKIEIFEIDGIPVFNQDDEGNVPEKVTLFKSKIRAADAILFATPEYNYGVPGALKNAIDWASRPYGDSAWEGKPVGLMGAAGGPMGTARAQYQLRQYFIFLNMFPVNRPEVMIGGAQKSFDEQGNLVNDASRKLIRQLLENLVAWTLRLRGGA